MILKGKGSKGGRGTPANRLPPSLERSRTQLDMTLSNTLQIWSWLQLPSWPSLDQRPPETPSNLNYPAIHGSKCKAWWCCISPLSSEVNCTVSALEGKSLPGLCYQTSCCRTPWWHPFSSAFANKTFSDYFQPCGTQSCRQFVTSIAFTVVVRFAEV